MNQQVPSLILKRMIRRLSDYVALELRRRKLIPVDHRHPRSSLVGLLKQVKSIGFIPASVIDVGAAFGSFALECHSVFPSAQYVLIEPLAEYSSALEAASKTLSRAEYIMAAATSSQAEHTVVNVHADLVGSSVYLEEEDSNVNGTPRQVQTVRLDEVVKRKNFAAPFLIKIDVQGGELDVLMGSGETLRNTEYVLLEVSFFEFFKGGPQFVDVVTFMASRGFVAYDICGLQYRPLDNALSQIDLAFVKDKGPFRKQHSYATREQRDEQNRRFESAMRRSINRI